MSPLRHFRCQVRGCEAEAPKNTLGHGGLKKRMSWLRGHRSRKHPALARQSARKAVRTRRSRKGAR